MSTKTDEYVYRVCYSQFGDYMGWVYESNVKTDALWELDRRRKEAGGEWPVRFYLQVLRAKED